MAWLESHQSLGRHPKLFRLSSQLRIHKAQAVGHLQYLWWWALDFAPTGNLSAFTPAEISAGAEWPGEPGPFQQALKDCQWIDKNGMIHDWFDYAGKLIESREKDRDRKRVQRTSAGHPGDGGQTADVPNPTQPTQPTEPKHRACGIAESPGFIRFWESWPKHNRKVNRRGCAKRWMTRNLEPSADSIIEALGRWKRSGEWCRGFIPLPMTWINEERWLAENIEAPDDSAAGKSQLQIESEAKAKRVMARLDLDANAQP